MKSEPIHYVWWLLSRASGVVALVLVSLSVLLGLAMAARALRRPGLKRTVVRLHEHLALASVGAVAVHGLSLLGDRWLKPGVAGIALPLVMHYRPAFTSAGIVAGYLLVLLGPSFYLRRRIGAARWRKLHRFILAVWILAVVHTLGAGSDGATLWLRSVVLVPLAPIVYLFVLRAGRGAATPRRSEAVRQPRAPARSRAPAGEGSAAG